MSFTIIDHRPDRTEIEQVLSKLTPYQGMLLFDWQPRGFIPSAPSLLGWIQREVVANAEQDFWAGSHNIANCQGYISLADAVKLVQELEPNYVLYGYSS